MSTATRKSTVMGHEIVTGAVAASGTPVRRRMRTLVAKAGVSQDVRDQLLESYRALGPNRVVAVRSSVTGEDGRDASFAGMNQTATNVIGETAQAELSTAKAPM